MNDLNIKWIRTPGKKILLAERIITVTGHVDFLINDRLVKRKPMDNRMLQGMGHVYAYASRTGTCNMINQMVGYTGTYMILLSTPTRTAGGQGATDSVTVQSTWTNTTGGGVTFIQVWLYCSGFPSGSLEIATVDNDSITVPNLATFTVNWTVQIPSTSCPFSAAQRNDMAQGINPQGAPHGGSLYNYTHMQFVWAAGSSGLQAVSGYDGGTGYDQVLATTGSYLRVGALVTVTEAEVYNSNGNLVDEITTLSEPLNNGETIQCIYTTTYQGASS